MAYKKITKKGKDFMYSIAEKNGTDGLIRGNNDYEIPFINDPEKRNMVLECEIYNDNNELINNNTDYIDYIIKKINEYAEIYDLDANIISAQLYIESGFKSWNYAKHDSSAIGISQFLFKTIYDVFLSGRSLEKPNFTEDEINVIKNNIVNPSNENSYNLGGFKYLNDKISNYNSFYRARENRYHMIFNIINNPDLMIKAQCRYMKYIAGRNYHLASNTLFAYNRGSSYKSDTYMGIINLVKSKKGSEYIKEGVKYVEKIFGVLADQYNDVVTVKPINKYYGYNLDLDRNKFDPYRTNIPVENSLDSENVLFILDRAHGAEVEERIFDGFEEWEYSSKVVNRLAKKLDDSRIPYVKNVPEDMEIGLENRVLRANEHSNNVKTPIFLSFHNNAGDGEGIELYTQKNPTSKEIEFANIFASKLRNNFPDIKWRKEVADRLYKEYDYTVLKGTNNVSAKYQGLLIEFLFMDNQDERSLLEDNNILEKYVNTLYKSIMTIVNKNNYSNID